MAEEALAKILELYACIRRGFMFVASFPHYLEAQFPKVHKILCHICRFLLGEQGARITILRIVQNGQEKAI